MERGRGGKRRSTTSKRPEHASPRLHSLPSRTSRLATTTRHIYGPRRPRASATGEIELRGRSLLLDPRTPTLATYIPDRGEASKAKPSHGEVAVLREGAHEQGRVDQGGGRAAGGVHPGARRRVLALAAQGGGAAALRQELPAALDELPPPGPQARQLHRRGGRAHHTPARHPRQQATCGRRWSLIAGQLPGRTDNEIKNYWNTHIKRKLLARGIDPQTHRPNAGAPAAAAAHRAAALLHATAAAPALAAAAARIAVKPAPAESSEDGGRSSSSGSGVASTGEPRCPDLNLDLSVGPPAADTPTSQPQPQPVCLCYRLGLRAGEACGCQADKPGPQGFRYFRPLEQGQYI